MLGAGHVRCSDPPPPSSWLGQGLGLGFGSGSRRDLANATGLLPGPLPNTHSPVRTLSCPREAVEPIPGMRRPRLPSSRLPPTVTPFMQRRPLPRTSPSGRPPPTEMPDCPAGCAPPRLASGLSSSLCQDPRHGNLQDRASALGTVHAPFSDTVLISLSSPSPGRGDSRHLPLDAPVWGLGSGEWGGLCSLLSAAGRHIRL